MGPFHSNNHCLVLARFSVITRSLPKNSSLWQCSHPGRITWKYKKEAEYTEIQNRSREDNGEIQNREIQNREIQISEIQNREIQSREIQNREIQNREVQNREIQDTRREDRGLTYCSYARRTKAMTPLIGT